MGWRRCVWAGPVEKCACGGGNLFIDSVLPAIVGVLVNVSSVQVKNPSLNIPLRDEVDDPFLISSRCQVGLNQRVLEVAKTSTEVSGVRIDCDDKSRLGSRRSSAVFSNLVYISFADPLFTASSSTREVCIPNVVFVVSKELQIRANELLMSRVLREDDDLGNPSHAPIRERPAQRE